MNSTATVGRQDVSEQRDHRVLIIDDDPDFAEGLAEFLNFHGYAVATANSPDSAADIAEAFRPDVALVDIRLGRWNGLDVVARLKSADSRPNCVMVTAYAELQTSIEALKLGADDYLRKPLRHDELLSVLDRCFERRRAEAARNRMDAQLRSSEESFRSTFDRAAIGMARIGSDGRIQRVNDRFGEILGLASAGLVDTRLAELVDGAKPEDIDGIMTALRTDDCPFVHRDVDVVRGDGSTVPASITMSLVRARGDNPEYYVAIIEDLSERNRQYGELVRGQRMEAVGQLTSGIAHDFNNLLMVVIGNLEVLQDSDFGAEQRTKALVNAERAAWQGAELTQRLLAFARRQPLRPQRTDLNTMIGEMTEMLDRTLGEEITLVLALAPAPCPIRVDAVQMENALLNLVVNARDAMPDGGILTFETAMTVLVAGEFVDGDKLEPDRYVVLRVTDTGVGMSPTTLERAVEPFFTTKEFGHGSGLGLSMVHGFVKQSGGAIRFRSEEGRGTTAEIYLRCEVGAAALD